MIADMTIECTSLSGHKVHRARSRLILRPSAYALIHREDKVLLVTNHHFGKFYLPGGGIEPGERITEGLRREVKEETGLDLGHERFLYFAEDFFYDDPRDKAYHGLLFYYAGYPKTFAVTGRYAEEDDEGHPQWVALENLTAQDFYNHGVLLMSLLHAAPFHLPPLCEETCP